MRIDDIFSSINNFHTALQAKRDAGLACANANLMR